MTGQAPGGRNRRDAHGIGERNRFVVRTAGPGDFSRVLDLHRHCLAEACRWHRRAVQEPAAFQQGEGAVAVLASRRDARGDVMAVACAAGWPGESGAWGLEVLVGEPWRGQGLGLAVATRAAGEAHLRGARLLPAAADARDQAMLALLGRLGAAAELRWAGSRRSWRFRCPAPRGVPRPAPAPCAPPCARPFPAANCPALLAAAPAAHDPPTRRARRLRRARRFRPACRVEEFPVATPVPQPLPGRTGYPEPPTHPRGLRPAQWPYPDRRPATWPGGAGRPVNEADVVFRSRQRLAPLVRFAARRVIRRLAHLA